MTAGTFLYLPWMRMPIALLLLASACGFSGADGQTPDAPMMEPEPPPKCEPGFVDLCGLTARAEDFIVGTTEVNTTNDPRCVLLPQAGGPELCLFYFNKVEVQQGGTLTVFGPRPFALAAKDTMNLRGRLDVSSKAIRPSLPGAGGGPATATGLCAFASAPEPANGGGGGGAGGTFATQGGRGGVGNNDNSPGMGNRAGGTPGPIFPEPAFLRGGCDGQTGAPGDPPMGALGGRGGGAVYLSAASLHITGEVMAGGAGGSAAIGNDDGGAGGGSGGFIVAQAAALTVNGMLLATGGGGGRGANQAGGDGGSDATSPNPAPGGDTGAGAGGAGATAGMGVDGTGNNGGGGGGGGGAGFILLLGEQINTNNAVIVPMAIQRTK